MDIISKIKDMREKTESWKLKGLSIGFVPTMGYLHDGHKSLIEKARSENDKVVVSIFVNPIQFGPNEDFEKYPRDIDRDTEICAYIGVDLIFAPEVIDMYPSGILSYVDVEELSDTLCGTKRPGHFRGVCTIVAKLFNIIVPDRAYFGEKDAQQLTIIKRMTLDLNFKTRIVPCPIIRESDGLAMSSRNSYLTSEERDAALIISKSLILARSALSNGERDAGTIKNIITKEICCEPLAHIDYVDVTDAFTLKAVDLIQRTILVAVAVYIGKIRLIDNFFFKEDSI